MTIAGELAAFLTATKAADLPPLALERAQMSIASTIASAAMGLDIESSRIIRDLAKEHGGPAEATVWFDGAKLPAVDAAHANALASDAAASDDSDLRSIAHIGTIVTSTSIAMAERLGKSGLDVLHAMTLGYEIAGRIDESLTPGRMQKGFHGSVSTVFGGTVATGTLLGLNAAQMEQAMAIAATSIGGIAIAANTSWAREYHAGQSAQVGMQAALAAPKGFLAEATVLEAPRGFLDSLGGIEREEITKDLGKSWDIVTDMAIKLVPGGHPFHAVAEAAANAAIEGNVDPAQVASIMISGAQFKDWHGPTHPRDLIGAAHSVVYFVASAIADRGFGWAHATEEKMNDPMINALADKISMDPNPAPLPDRFTHRHGGTVIITMNDGTVHRNTCEAPRGSGPRGVEWGDVDAKYRRLVPLSGLAADRIEASLEVVHNFTAVKSMSELTGLLLK
ncbi:MAG: MmgE/PrpD family protein [Chloroflexota bacterium]